MLVGPSSSPLAGENIEAAALGDSRERRWRGLVGGFRGRFSRLGTLERIALYGLALLTLALIVLPSLTTHYSGSELGPPLRPPSAKAWLGTDEQGRDLLARLLLGMRTSWLAALVVIASGVLIGGSIGLLAGMAGGWVDVLLMRATDLSLGLPGPLLVMAVVSALGPGLRNTLIAVMAVWWPFYARIVRGEVRAIMSRPHVEAARMGGIGRLRLGTRHVLPGSFGAVLVTASLDIGALILTLAALSFLGLGAPPPAPELGAMTSRGLTYLFTGWWVPVFPASAVFLLSLVGNFAGDAVRDLVEG